VDKRILFEISPWFTLLCFLIGLVYTLLLYKQKNPWGQKISLALGVFRFLVVSAISFLLLGPLIRYIQNTTIDPSYVIVIDNSRSIPETYTETTFSEIINQLAELENNLPSREFELKIKDISGMEYETTDQIKFDAPYTDLNNGLKTIENEYEGKNLAGIILVSDGIYNQGSSPMYSNFSFPIYSVGIGDTTEKEDIILKSINHNKIVYQGNMFLLQAEIYNKGFSKRSITVSVRNKGKILEQKTLLLESDNGLQTTEFEIESEESGMQRFEVFITPFDSEFSVENNVLNAYVEVVEGKEKILILAQAPHPDIKALKSIVEKNDNYEIELLIPGIGTKKEQKYDLAILHQLPDNRNTYNTEIQNILDNETPVLYLLGLKTNLSKFNSINRTINIRPRGNRRDNVFVSLNDNFGLFNLSESLKSIITELPPVTVPFGEYKVKGESEAVLYQQIGKIPTQKPLLILNKNQSNKEAVLIGEGLWKWRLNEYLLTSNFNGIDNLFNKIIQYLSAKEDRRQFKVYPLHTENWNNEPVIIENEIYNDIYEKIFDQKIDLTLTDEQNNTFEYSYIISKANSQFRISGLEPGVYQYNAKTNLNGEIKTSDGMFSIKKLLVEISNLKANFNMLRELSRRSSGKFFSITEIEEMTNEIQSAEIPSLMYSSENYLAIINLKWIFFLILSLITLEWGIRKFLGGY
jgi:hypothetical protein